MSGSFGSCSLRRLVRSRSGLCRLKVFSAQCSRRAWDDPSRQAHTQAQEETGLGVLFAKRPGGDRQVLSRCTISCVTQKRKCATVRRFCRCRIGNGWFFDNSGGSKPQDLGFTAALNPAGLGWLGSTGMKWDEWGGGWGSPRSQRDRA